MGDENYFLTTKAHDFTGLTFSCTAKDSFDVSLIFAGNIDRPAAAPPISSEVRDHLRTLFSSRADIDSVTSLYSLVNQRRTSSPLSSATTTSSDNAKYTNRASICSMRKFPGETPVKDLEPTLKMIIIKELSRERAEGKST